MRNNEPSIKNRPARRLAKDRSAFRWLFVKTLSLILTAAMTIGVHVRSRSDVQCVDPRKWTLLDADVRIRVTSGDERGDCRE